MDGGAIFAVIAPRRFGAHYDNDQESQRRAMLMNELDCGVSACAYLPIMR
jgi:hypothetical protein